MNGVTVTVAPVTGAPTTPAAIALTCTTQVLLLKPGGAGSADISLKSSWPALPACSRPTTYVSPRPLLMHATARRRVAGGGGRAPAAAARGGSEGRQREQEPHGSSTHGPAHVTKLRAGSPRGSITPPNMRITRTIWRRLRHTNRP